MEPSPTPIVLDASILLNFVKVGRIDLLGALDSSVLLLDQVRAEVVRPAQSQVVTEAITAGIMTLESVTNIAEVTLFADLRADGRLGAGECAVLAVALHRHWVAGLQDKRARAEGRRRRRALRLCGTEDLMVTLLRSGAVTLAEADQLLVEWATQHRFRLKIASFGELL